MIGCQRWRPTSFSVRVAVIAANGAWRTQAAKAATATIPIVFTAGLRPGRGSDLCGSLNRPGGNVTGRGPSWTWSWGPKRLELLHDLVPTATVIAALVNPTRSRACRDHIERAAGGWARTLGLQFHVLKKPAPTREFDAVFAALGRTASRRGS